MIIYLLLFNQQLRLLLIYLKIVNYFIRLKLIYSFEKMCTFCLLFKGLNCFTVAMLKKF